MLTEGTFDDREPIFSHDGTRIAFSSDRGDPLGSDNNIWVLDVKSGGLSQLTTNPAEDTMPAWSPDDKEIAFISSRDTYKTAWAIECRHQSGAADRQRQRRQDRCHVLWSERSAGL